MRVPKYLAVFLFGLIALAFRSSMPGVSAFIHVGHKSHAITHVSSVTSVFISPQQFFPFKCAPTVFPADHFDPQSDAAKLMNAMKGWGTDECGIIDVLAKRCLQQRLEIAQVYKTLYGKDLVDELKDELSGKFSCVIVAMMTPLEDFYANELHAAVTGLGTDEDAIIDILTTLSNTGITKVSEKYKQLFNTTLEADIECDTSGHFKNLLVSLSTANRNECLFIDKKAAIADAKSLKEAGVDQWGTEESIFNKIMITRSYKQLKQIFFEYEKMSDETIEQSIRKEFYWCLKDGLLAIVKCAKDKAGYFAERLHDSMACLGTSDNTLIRIIVSRSEIDLCDIKEAFCNTYKKTLEDYVIDDTSGDYKKALLALLG